MLVAANVLPSSVILFTLMMDVYVASKRRLLLKPHGVKFQETAFSIVTAMKTSILT
jgi:hypothetical protein